MRQFARHVAKSVLAANLACLVRAARFGPRDAAARLSASYATLDPFGRRSVGDEGELELAATSATIDEGESELAATFATIKEVALAEIAGSLPTVIVDSRFASEEGSLPLHELVPFLVILRAEAPKSVLEIGTYFGSTTANMALNLLDATIVTVDLPEEFEPEDVASGVLKKDDFHLIRRRQLGRAFKTLGSIGNVVQHFGDTAAWDFSEAGPDTTFAFIDGSHTYDYALNDTIKFMSIATRESTILWHDCDPSHPGVVRWLGEMVAAGFPIRRIEGTYLAHLKFRPEDVPREWLDAYRSALDRGGAASLDYRPEQVTMSDRPDFRGSIRVAKPALARPILVSERDP